MRFSSVFGWWMAGQSDPGSARRVGARPVPARPVDAVGDVRRGVQLEEREVGSGARRPEERSRLELGEEAVARPPARGASRGPANGVLEVPVRHEGGRVGGADPAVVRGEEVGLPVSRRVVDHRSRAERAAPEAVHRHRADLVAPRVALGTDDVHVAGPRLQEVGRAEALVVVVDQARQEVELGAALRGERDLDHDRFALHHGRPELAMRGVVLLREGTHDVAKVGGVDEQAPARRHVVAAEPEVERSRSRGDEAQTPHPHSRLQLLPETARGGGRVHLERQGEARGHVLAFPRRVLLQGRSNVHRRQSLEGDVGERPGRGVTGPGLPAVLGHYRGRGQEEDPRERYLSPHYLPLAAMTMPLERRIVNGSRVAGEPRGGTGRQTIVRSRATSSQERTESALIPAAPAPTP